MNVWNQIVLGCGYLFLGNAAIILPGTILFLWRDNRASRRKQQEVNELERMYEG